MFRSYFSEDKNPNDNKISKHKSVNKSRGLPRKSRQMKNKPFDFKSFLTGVAIGGHLCYNGEK